MTMTERALIVGAGVAGLSLGRQLTNGGYTVTVVDKGRRPGGRCASREVEGQPFDHGVPLLHGKSVVFTRAVARSAPDALMLDWPSHVKGSGVPCQPQAFDVQSWRVALADGVSTFPSWLARGLQVRQRARVLGLSVEGDHVAVKLEGGEVLEERTVALTLPAPQVTPLLEPLAKGCPEVRALIKLLYRVSALPCLTTMAGYDRPVDRSWHMVLPGPGSPVHTLVNDSSKRQGEPRQVLVIQGAPGFSGLRLEDPSESWASQLLQAAAKELGDWVLESAWQHHHRWRYARVSRENLLQLPVLLQLEGGARLGLCGEAFNPAGGVEGAYLSGRELANRMVNRTETAVARAGDQ